MKLNLGCGTVHFEGWVNVDKIDNGHNMIGDILDTGLYLDLGEYDYIFCNHMLSDFSHHELPIVLDNIKNLLKPDGKVHILVPDALAAYRAFEEGDFEWFPQGDDMMSSIDERYCTFLTWFGESKSIFTAAYLLHLGRRAGFKQCQRVAWGSDPHDDRQFECIVAEFTR